MLAQPQSTFAIANLSGIVLHEQVGVNPPAFIDISLPVSSGLLNGLGSVVIGSYESPSFLERDQTIRPVPTLAGTRRAGRTSTRLASTRCCRPRPSPPAGYPVVIFGHGFGDSRFGGPTAVAPALARAGFAVVAIDAVGHGFGPLEHRDLHRQRRQQHHRECHGPRHRPQRRRHHRIRRRLRPHHARRLRHARLLPPDGGGPDAVGARHAAGHGSERRRQARPGCRPHLLCAANRWAACTAPC